MTPKANPLEDNPNHWHMHTSGLPVFKMTTPIEVEYESGERKIIRTPNTIDHEEAKTIRFWRWHAELEKMPFWTKFHYHRVFTLKDRIRILFGKNIVIPIALATRHNPGAVHPVMICYVTDTKDVDGFMKEQLAEATKRYLKDGAKESK